jgi:hypothetical protein
MDDEKHFDHSSGKKPRMVHIEYHKQVVRGLREQIDGAHKIATHYAAQYQDQPCVAGDFMEIAEALAQQKGGEPKRMTALEMLKKQHREGPPRLDGEPELYSGQCRHGVPIGQDCSDCNRYHGKRAQQKDGE